MVNGKGWEDDYDLTPIQGFRSNKVVKGAPEWSSIEKKPKEVIPDW